MESSDAKAAPVSTLRLPRAAYLALRVHAEETYPHECCGVLLGHSTPEGWRIEEAVRAANAHTDSAHNRYCIAPKELVKIEIGARRRGLQIAGFYHSHPDHGAQWSATDLAEAHWLGCSYVITAVAQGKAMETNSFLLSGTREECKRFVREVIRLDGETAGAE
ncbi:MAG: M67 family metallopeptidase [Acidobacteriota bacterium]|nr:M67 family metallopeptidase [Acidobacteriota bacterium]